MIQISFLSKYIFDRCRLLSFRWLMQDCSNSIANTLGLRQSCNKPSFSSITRIDGIHILILVQSMSTIPFTWYMHSQTQNRWFIANYHHILPPQNIPSQQLFETMAVWCRLWNYFACSACQNYQGLLSPKCLIGIETWISNYSHIFVGCNYSHISYGPITPMKLLIRTLLNTGLTKLSSMWEHGWLMTSDYYWSNYLSVPWSRFCFSNFVAFGE